jgi:cob(I)alamin adenosyltransferase
VVVLQEMGMLVNTEVLRYVNRLADLLFMLARYEDRALPFEVVTGKRQ